MHSRPVTFKSVRENNLIRNIVSLKILVISCELSTFLYIVVLVLSCRTSLLVQIEFRMPFCETALPFDLYRTPKFDFNHFNSYDRLFDLIVP